MGVTENATTAPPVRLDETRDEALDPNVGREEQAWLEANEAALARQHPGWWVAVHGSQLVAIADSLQEALERARAAGCTDPFVSGLPTDPDEALYF